MAEPALHVTSADEPIAAPLDDTEDLIWSDLPWPVIQQASTGIPAAATGGSPADPLPAVPAPLRVLPDHEPSLLSDDETD